MAQFLAYEFPIVLVLFVAKTVVPPLNGFLIFVKTQLTTCVGLFLASVFSSIHACVFVSTKATFSITVSLETEKSGFLHFILLFTRPLLTRLIDPGSKRRSAW